MSEEDDGITPKGDGHQGPDSNEMSDIQDQDLGSWLAKNDLSHLLETLQSQAITLDVLGDLTEADLVAVGVSEPTDREKLLSAAAKQAQPAEDKEALSAWLEANDLSSMLPALTDDGFTLARLLEADEAALKQAGIKPMGARKKLMLAVGKERTGIPHSVRVTQGLGWVQERINGVIGSILGFLRAKRLIIGGLFGLLLIAGIAYFVISKMPKPFGEDYPFALSVADTRYQSDAQATALRLENLGIHAEVVKTRASNTAAWFHVLVGQAADRERLTLQQKQLETEKGLKGLRVINFQDWGPSMEPLPDAGPAVEPSAAPPEQAKDNRLFTAHLNRLLALAPRSESHPISYAALYLSDRVSEEFPFYEGARSHTRTDMPRGLKREELLPHLSAHLELRFYDPIYDETLVMHVFKLARSQVDNSLSISRPIQHFSTQILGTGSYLSEKKAPLNITAYKELAGQHLSIETEIGSYRHYAILFDPEEDIGIFLQAADAGWERGQHLLNNLGAGGGLLTQERFTRLIDQLPVTPPRGADLTLLSLSVDHEDFLKATAGMPILTAWYREPFRYGLYDRRRRNRKKQEWAYEVTWLENKEIANSGLADKLYELSKKKPPEEIADAYAGSIGYYSKKQRRVMLAHESYLAEVRGLKRVLSRKQMIDHLSRLRLGNENGYIRSEHQISALPEEGVDLTEEFAYMADLCSGAPKDGLIARLQRIWAQHVDCMSNQQGCSEDGLPSLGAHYDQVASSPEPVGRRSSEVKLRVRFKDAYFMGLPVHQLILAGTPESDAGFKNELTLGGSLDANRWVLTRNRHWRQKVDDSIGLNVGLIGATLRKKGRSKTVVSCTSY